MNFRKLIKNLMLQVGGLKFSNQVLLLIDIRCQSSLTQGRNISFKVKAKKHLLKERRKLS